MWKELCKSNSISSLSTQTWKQQLLSMKIPFMLNEFDYWFSTKKDSSQSKYWLVRESLNELELMASWYGFEFRKYFTCSDPWDFTCLCHKLNIQYVWFFTLSNELLVDSRARLIAKERCSLSSYLKYTRFENLVLKCQ